MSPPASESEAAAIAAALEQFLAETAPAPDSARQPESRWLRAALTEGVSARQVGAGGWAPAAGRRTAVSRP